MLLYSFDSLNNQLRGFTSNNDISLWVLKPSIYVKGGFRVMVRAVVVEFIVFG